MLFCFKGQIPRILLDLEEICCCELTVCSSTASLTEQVLLLICIKYPANICLARGKTAEFNCFNVCIVFNTLYFSLKVVRKLSTGCKVFQA